MSTVGTSARLTYEPALTTHYTSDQLASLKQMYDLAKRHLGTSSGNAAAKLLLGLYNGRRFPFDLTDLRLFDLSNLDAALIVLRLDSERTFCEVHQLLDAICADTASTGAEFEQWAYALKLKGRCKKDNLPDAWRSRS